MVSLLHVLLILLSIAIIAQICGRLFAYFKQPFVVGEILSGILLGPSFLGRFFPEFSQMFLPSRTVEFIGIFAQIGIIFYMFVVGLELDLKTLKVSGKAIVSIAAASMLLPFTLGLGLAFFLFTRLSDPSQNSTHFALFFGVSLSITAFPVLVRILDDIHLRQTTIGMVTTGCAAIGDAVAWCLLAAIVSVVKSNGQGTLAPLLLTCIFAFVMLTAVRILCDRFFKWYRNSGGSDDNAFPFVLAGAMVSAILTEWIGIHAIFGAFLFGAVLPHDDSLTHSTTDKMQSLLKALFLPAFFAFTGIRTQMSLVSGVEDWLLCLLIVLVATIGKFGGAFAMARVFGFKLRESLAIGSLMNARGLVELIVLNVGLDLGIISPRLFTMLVIMAVITTFATTPITLYVLKQRSL